LNIFKKLNLKVLNNACVTLIPFDNVKMHQESAKKKFASMKKGIFGMANRHFSLYLNSLKTHLSNEFRH